MSRGAGNGSQPQSAPVPSTSRKVSACERCGGDLEASGKVYFDITACSSSKGGIVTVSDMEFSPLNDAYDGNPCAIETELKVSCKECGYEPRFIVRDRALERGRWR